MRETGLFSIEKYEQHCIYRQEKTVSNTQLIEIMFATQQSFQSQNLISKDINTVSWLLEQKDSERVSENTKTIKTKAIQDSFKLIRLKTKELKKN